MSSSSTLILLESEDPLETPCGGRSSESFTVSENGQREGKKYYVGGWVVERG